mmetsp:Transcript_6159/g.17543  ORF Transcript_6159/g.17543 Transcript_6159/m.17543 type:complete len:373 (+) Transcript_6159:75-1193(+)
MDRDPAGAGRILRANNSNNINSNSNINNHVFQPVDAGRLAAPGLPLSKAARLAGRGRTEGIHHQGHAGTGTPPQDQGLFPHAAGPGLSGRGRDQGQFRNARDNLGGPRRALLRGAVPGRASGVGIRVVVVVAAGTLPNPTPNRTGSQQESHRAGTRPGGQDLRRMEEETIILVVVVVVVVFCFAGVVPAARAIGFHSGPSGRYANLRSRCGHCQECHHRFQIGCRRQQQQQQQQSSAQEENQGRKGGGPDETHAEKVKTNHHDDTRQYHKTIIPQQDSRILDSRNRLSARLPAPGNSTITTTTTVHAHAHAHTTPNLSDAALRKCYCYCCRSILLRVPCRAAKQWWSKRKLGSDRIAQWYAEPPTHPSRSAP